MTANYPPPNAGPESKPQPTMNWLKVLTAAAGIIGAIASLATAAVKFQALRGPAAAPVPSPSALPAAASPVTPAPTPTLNVSPTAEKVVSIWEDHFSNPASGWDSGADADAEWGYHGGEYRIVVHAPDLVAWGNPIAENAWANVAVTVQARRVEGPVDNQYGVIVRQVDDANFYLFNVSSDGMYSVQRLRNNEWQDLVTWTHSTAVLQGEAPNVLRLECRDSYIRFYVNDQLLTTVEDGIFYSGNVGLAAGSFGEGGVVVHFDNLVMRTLP